MLDCYWNSGSPKEQSRYYDDLIISENKIGMKSLNPTNSAFIKNNAPVNFTLDQNYPNPFSSKTKIEYTVPGNARTVLKIYNIFGREVTTLVDEQQPPGRYSVHWNGTNHAGTKVKSGIYYCRLSCTSAKADCLPKTRKVLLLRN